MQPSHTNRPLWPHLFWRVLVSVGFAVSVLFSGSAPVSHADYIAPFTIGLIGAGIVRFSPPTLADLNNDGNPDIVVGTADGKVFALRYTAPNSLTVLWQHTTTTDLGAPTSIRGAISVADLDQDGIPEVVVPVGDVGDYYGGLVTLNGSTGTTRWTYRTFDVIRNTDGFSAPDGKSDAVISAPTLADLDNDGRLEIIFGSSDHRVHALHSDGTSVTGWPVFVRDTVRSSAAIADLDGDGFVEVIIGVDAHLEGAPFNTPNGGCLYVFRGDGQIMWRQCINEVIYSAPAVGDLEGDGQLDIVHGTGNYFGNTTDGFKLYAWTATGGLKWAAPTNGFVPENPALGDIDNDGTLEVVVGVLDQKVYAFNHNGTALWTVTPTNNNGSASFIGSPTLAIANAADSVPDVFINVLGDVGILNGPNGAQLTMSTFPVDARPGYITNCTTQDNAPAIGDIDGDGKLELIAASATFASGCATGAVHFWRLNSDTPNTPFTIAGTTPWPMSGQNARHTRLFPHALALDAEVVTHTLPALLGPGERRAATITVRNLGTTNWNAASLIRLGAVGDADPFSAQTRLNLNGGEQVMPGQSRTFTLTLQAPLSEGYYPSDWRLVNDSTGTWFGRTAKVVIKVGNQPALQTLTSLTPGMHAGGLATADLLPPIGYTNWSAAKVWKLTTTKTGYHLLDSFGGYWYGGSAFPLISLGIQPTIQDMVLGPDGISYYELLGDGRLYRCDPNSCTLHPFNPATPTGIVARSLALASDGQGVYVVDAAGALYLGGTAPPLNPPANPSGNIVRMKLTPTASGYYVLDREGRVWNGGAAPALTPLDYTIHIGQDWARDFELLEDGRGYYVLDAYGAIHAGGVAQPLTLHLPPTSTGDIGRDLELVDTRRLPGLSVLPLSTRIFHALGSTAPAYIGLTLFNTGGENFDWAMTSSMPSAMSFSATSGNVAALTSTGLSAFVTTPELYGLGTYTFTANITATTNLLGSTERLITMQLDVVDSVYTLYLPLALR